MKQLTAKEVENALDSINVIDVREADEAASGKIPGATNIPLGLLEFCMHELDISKEYTIVCRSGGRSGRAAQFLEGKGFKVINMTGGMLEWDGKTE